MAEIEKICSIIWVSLIVLGCISGLVGFVAWSITWKWDWYFYAIFYGGMPTFIVMLWSLIKAQYLGL